MKRGWRISLGFMPLAVVSLAIVLQVNYLGSDCTVLLNPHTQPQVDCVYHYRYAWLAGASQEWIISNLYVFALLAGGFELGYWWRSP